MPALHLDRVALQIEVWADRMVEAEDLAIEIVEALGRLRGQVFNGVAFAHVKTDNVLGSMDPAFSPAKPRIVIDATVWVRH